MTLRSILATAAFACVCISPTFANAQTAPAATTASVDPERLALAHQLIDSMNIPKVMHGTFEKVFSNFSGSMGELDMHQYALSMTAGFEAMMPSLLDEEAKVYAEVLTTDDLRQAVAFHQSQAGKDLLAAVPTVSERVTPLVYAAMPKMLKAVNEDYCKHVQCTDDVKAAFKAEDAMFNQMAHKGAHPAK
ncbi:MAG TPA: DUF2059 domain-containing protein [Caulobacteraceae bacterium]|jgi:hypothetical protein